MKQLLLAVLLSLLFAPYADAKINGKNVIFIHGFQPDAFSDLGSNRIQKLRDAALNQAGPFLKNRFEDAIYFDSVKRLSSNAASIRDQVKRIEREGTCSNGCYFVTLSTGDLVFRYIMSRLGQWGVDSSKFRALLTFDIVGAGGGTEGADVLVSATQGNFISQGLADLIGTIFLGKPVSFNSEAGIVSDLRPTIARNTATQSFAVPRLRIVGGKTTFLVSSVLMGGDDGVMPMHSACGSAVQESVDSCSRSIKADGEVTSASGPRNFYYNHFPVYMGIDRSHTDELYKGRMVAVNNGKNFGFFRYNVAENTFTTGWWIFKKTFRTISKPSTILADEFLIKEIER